MTKRNSAQLLAIALSAVCVGACTRTVVRLGNEMLTFGLPRPQQILVYNFAVTESEVTENRDPLRTTKTSGTSEGEPEREIRRQVVNALAEELVRGPRDLGFDVERKSRGTLIGNHELVIDGMFPDVDEGNRLKCLVIGFGVAEDRRG